MGCAKAGLRSDFTAPRLRSPGCLARCGVLGVESWPRRAWDLDFALGPNRGGGRRCADGAGDFSLLSLAHWGRRAGLGRLEAESREWPGRRGLCPLRGGRGGRHRHAAIETRGSDAWIEWGGANLRWSWLGRGSSGISWEPAWTRASGATSALGLRGAPLTAQGGKGASGNVL